MQVKIEKHVDSYRIGNRKETTSFESHKFNEKGKIRKAHVDRGELPQSETVVGRAAAFGTFKPDPMAFGPWSHGSTQ